MQNTQNTTNIQPADIPNTTDTIYTAHHKKHQLKNEIILITGVAGFIGSHVAERILKTTNHRVIGVDNMNDYYDQKQKQDNLNLLIRYPNFIFYKEDATTTNKVKQHLPTIIIHLAAMAGVRYSLENPTLYVRNNVEMMTHLLDETVKHCANTIKNFIYASSSSVYGTNRTVPFSEFDLI